MDDEQGIGVTIASAPRAFELGGGVEFMADLQSERSRRKSPVSGVR